MLSLSAIAITSTNPIVSTCGGIKDVHFDSGCCGAHTNSSLSSAYVSLSGETVAVEGTWESWAVGPIQSAFSAFTQRTGINVVVTGSGAEFEAKVEDPTRQLPDIAMLPSANQVLEAAVNSRVVSIESLGIDVSPLNDAFSPYMMGLTSRDAKHFAVPHAANVKSNVFYQPAEFEARGYTVPTTWDELIALSDRIVADGMNPWCLGIYSNGATGWVVTDWLEDMMLRVPGGGVETYDKWGTNELPFTDPVVKDALQRMSHIFHTENYVHQSNPESVFFGNAMDPMFERDSSGNPGCFMHKQASFIQYFGALATGDTTQYPGISKGFSVFPFPKIDTSLPDTAMGGGSFLSPTNTRPATKAVFEFLTSAEFADAFVTSGGTELIPHAGGDSSLYSGLNNIMVNTLRSAIASNAFRFDASDRMPGSGWFVWGELTKFLTDGATYIDAATSNIDATWKTFPPPEEPSLWPTTTLDKIKQGNLKCGYSPTQPFAYQKDGYVQGIDADFCRMIASVITGDPMKVEFVQVSPVDRFDKLKNKAIDVLARYSTQTVDREVTYGITFPFINYYDGAKLLSRDPDVTSFDTLSGTGTPICVVDQTTSYYSVSGIATYVGSTVSVYKDSVTGGQTTYGYELMKDAFASGECSVVMADESILLELRLLTDTPTIFPDEPITREPLGVAVRKDESELIEIVKTVGDVMVFALSIGLTKDSCESFDECATTANHPGFQSLLAGRANATYPSLPVASVAFGETFKRYGNFEEYLGRHDVSLSKPNKLYPDGGARYIPQFGYTGCPWKDGC